VIYVTETNKTIEPRQELMRRGSKSSKLGPLVPEIRALARYSASGRVSRVKGCRVARPESLKTAAVERDVNHIARFEPDLLFQHQIAKQPIWQA
jgi:hypothetical protein